jgi:hypothetical protein
MGEFSSSTTTDIDSDECDERLLAFARSGTALEERRRERSYGKEDAGSRRPFISLG